MSCSAVPKNPLQIKREQEHPQATEEQLQAAAALMAALWSPRSRWRRNPTPWRR